MILIFKLTTDKKKIVYILVTMLSLFHIYKGIIGHNGSGL